MSDMTYTHGFRLASQRAKWLINAAWIYKPKAKDWKSILYDFAEIDVSKKPEKKYLMFPQSLDFFPL